MNSYTEILEAAKTADIVSWHRDSQTLDLVIDRMEIDLRKCYTLRIRAGDAGRLELRKLTKYDEQKHIWCEYVGNRMEFEMPDKRGLKALLGWIKSKAMEKCEWVPNPEFLSIYNGVPS